MGDQHRHESPEARLPPPCVACGKQLGVYEPIVIPEQSAPTSWLRLRPEQRSNGLRAWHPNCRPGKAPERG